MAPPGPGAPEGAPAYAPVYAPPAFVPAEPATAGDIMQRGLVIITLVVLGIALLVFLWAVNQFITVWFRAQWVPIGRGVASAAVIAGCALMLRWLMRRRRG